jgi:hypothetical protein
LILAVLVLPLVVSGKAIFQGKVCGFPYCKSLFYRILWLIDFKLNKGIDISIYANQFKAALILSHMVLRVTKYEKYGNQLQNKFELSM